VTASLPPQVREAFERFITCEYTTIDARHQPIVWPVTPYYEDGAASVDLTTGLGYPKKANDARRNPSVALLFSDPTGSGVTGGVQVLVQGTADVDDRDLAANRERYWRESWEKLPGTRKLHPPKFVRGMLGWYYTRIYVHVRPERVFVWTDGDVQKPPECHDAHLEEVRSGHIEEPLQAHEPPAGGHVAWDGRIEELGRRHATAVLGWVAPDGFPLAVRLPVRADPGRRRIVFDAEPAGLPLMEGRACVTAHAHSLDFSWQENFQVRGDLVRADGALALVPHRLIGGFELPNESRLAGIRRNLRKSIHFHRTARRELREREGKTR
jgi:Pyridoxamine 5'-phosphate oxidase